MSVARTAALAGSTPVAAGLPNGAAGLRYGALGLPLAFVALPLYIVLPNHYAEHYGVPLAALGAVLLGARLLDALADPLIGRWADRLFARSARVAWWFAAAAACLLAVGFAALFFPPVQGQQALLWWCALVLAPTYLAYSGVSVVHQSWGARLGGNEAERARVMAWREGAALLGVLIASLLPALAGLRWTSAAFALLLAAGVLLLRQAPHPARRAGATPPDAGLLAPLAVPAFKRLLAIFMVNGIASAVPATLVLFFIRDRLQLPAWEPIFLFTYFATGALFIPLWLRSVSRFGLAPTWLASMLLAVLAFIGASLLGAGDAWPFLAVCVASGAALAADLLLPGALLAGVIAHAGDAGRAEGAYFGWWNFATKLNLALAAGVALPLLDWLGFRAGARDAEALGALTLAYCLLPCLLKLLAAALLWRLWLHPSHARKHG